jgi:hypothetical protein
MFKEIWPVLAPATVGAIVFFVAVVYAIAERRSRTIK